MKWLTLPAACRPDLALRQWCAMNARNGATRRIAARLARGLRARIIPARNILPGGGAAAQTRTGSAARSGYSAGTIEGARAAALFSLRSSTARRIFAIMFRNARVSGFGVRKCEANSLLISSGRQ